MMLSREVEETLIGAVIVDPNNESLNHSENILEVLKLTRPDRGYPVAQLPLSTLELSPVHKYDPQPPIPGPTTLAPSQYWPAAASMLMDSSTVCMLEVDVG